jgi:hypothetical protein
MWFPNIAQSQRDLLEKSELAQCACEGHMVSLDEARILEIENNSR